MPKTNYYGLILAGGRGTRFWPRSRRSRAKQVLKLFGDRSLIQQTVDRLAPVIPPDRIYIITNDHLRGEIVKQLPEVPKSQILAEPVQRNTAPAIGIVAQILEKQDPDAVLGVFPADHLISKPSRYIRLLKPALKAAEAGQIAVLGIEARFPETGFGYVELASGAQPGDLEVHEVKSFREKPDLPTAKKFVKAGRFYWNAGMFFWKASVYNEALRQYLPETAAILDELPAFNNGMFGRRLRETFPMCENISVDYAVLEKADNVVGVAADDIGWNDVGTWNAVYELQAHKEGDNVCRSEMVAIDSEGNYVDAGSRFVGLLGVKNLVIVETEDAILVADRERSQEVGDLVKALEKKNRADLL